MRKLKYTGDGVIVGIIDGGFDYTHPTFYNADYTQYRISHVWEQGETGTPPSGFGYGNELVGQSEILNDAYSSTTGSHGTHVAGIAAGSGSVSDYKGVAFESEIVLVPYAGLDPYIADGISYIFDYANSVNKPAVVNMSLGTHIGPHDGTSSFDQFCDGIVGEGNILVGAAGNEGSDKLHLDYDLGTNETVYSFLEFPGNTENPNGGATYIDIWGEQGDDFIISINLYNIQDDAYVDYTDYISTSTDGTYSFTLIDPDPVNSDECIVNIGVEHSNSNNSKPHIFVVFDNTDQNEVGDIYDYVMLEVIGTNTSFDAWCSGSGEAIFTDKGASYPVINGNTNLTVGEIGGTGNSIITVGAYTSKNNYTDFQGNNHNIPFYTEVGEIAPFSSLGPTVDGRTKPDITAPGNVIVSSVNSFDANYNSTNPECVMNVNNGTDYWWFASMQGTSMASPMVTGIIALWLEANPSLTPDEIKQFMQNNAWTDSYTGSVPNNTWGYGKVDAHETILDIETQTSEISASSNPGVGGSVNGDGFFLNGETCNLTASAQTGYNFVNWTENGTQVSANANYSFTVTANRTLVANFEIQTFNISASANPSSGGTVSGTGTFNYGQTANLTASVQTGYNFVNWTENGTQVSTNANYSFTVTANRTLVANFEIQTFNISASANPSSGGTVSGTGTFDYGQTANLTASAQTGYNFVNWTENGTQVSTNTNYSFTVTANRTLVANFDEIISVSQLDRNSFEIYPNPTSSNFFIKSNLFSEHNSKTYKLYLIDYLGQEFRIDYNKDFSDVIQIDMNNLSSGVYYLKIMDNNELIGSFKIIKII